MESSLIPYTIFIPGDPPKKGEILWPDDPGFDRINRFVQPILGPGRNLEHVTVWLSQQLDMFVDELGALPPQLPFNPEATKIYQNASILRGAKAEDLPCIYGPAVLFHRRVWF